MSGYVVVEHEPDAMPLDSSAVYTWAISTPGPLLTHRSTLADAVDMIVERLPCPPRGNVTVKPYRRGAVVSVLSESGKKLTGANVHRPRQR